MTDDGSVDDGDRMVERAKFDIGAPPQLASASIPWGYGENRITALVRSPEHLYLYWEMTDEGIVAARARLGPAGEHAWCNLRVYDTTARDFDGTNANHYIDIRVERGSREYFLPVHRPGSSAYVEVGMKSHEGYFQPVARSGRAEFPRKSPSPNTSIAWMTVTSEDACPAAQPCRSRYRGPTRSLPGQYPAPQPASAVTQSWTTQEWTRRVWTEQVSTEWTSVSIDGLDFPFDPSWLVERWQVAPHAGFRFLRWTGEGPSTLAPGEVVTWQVGPFPIEAIDADRVEVHWGGVGPLVVAGEWGPIEVFGPWRVTVRSFDTQPARRVLASWTVHWVNITPVVVERWLTGLERRRVGGFAREQRIQGASESLLLREFGASDVFRLGASERMWLGASAGMLLGASEVLGWGASQLAFAGASALLLRGASQWIWVGASEWLWSGASELYAWGASELYARGASEAWSGLMAGGSEHVAASIREG
jgi:hypothetical protein